MLKLTKLARVESAEPLLEIEKELAKQRQQKAGELFGRGKVRQNFGEAILEGKALELFAEEIGSNPETVRQALWLMENAPEEELEKGNPSANFLVNGKERALRE
jgi:hypothetical protein